MKRAKTIMKRLREDTEYQKFFQAAMDKFKINTPADLKDPAKKKEFFDYVDNNYKAKSEITETNKNMKATEFKKLIREEVRKVLKENTMLMRDPSVKAKVDAVIGTLKGIDVDGETMEYIIKEVGMEDQMQHQLTPGGIREQDNDYGVSFAYMKPYTQDLQQAIRTLQVLNDKIETDGPLSEDIVDALESLEGLYNKIKQAR